MGKKVWLIPLSIILFIGYKKLNIAKRFSVNIWGFDFSTLSLLNPVLTLRVEILNPTDATAELQNIKGSLKCDGVFVGDVKGINQTTIKTGSTIFDFPILLDFEGIFNVLTKLKTQGINFDFNGTMVIDNITLPLNFQYNT